MPVPHEQLLGQRHLAIPGVAKVEQDGVWVVFTRMWSGMAATCFDHLDEQITGPVNGSGTP